MPQGHTWWLIWWLPPLVVVKLPFLFRGIICFLFRPLSFGLQLLSFLLAFLFGLPSFLCCLSYFLGICMLGPLPGLPHLGWFMFRSFSYFSFSYYFAFRCSEFYVFFRAIRLVTSSIFCTSLVFSCIRRTSSIHSRSLSFSPFLSSSPMSFCWSLWLFHPLGLHIRWLIALLAVYCLLSLFLSWAHIWFGFVLWVPCSVFWLFLDFFPTPFLYNAYRMAYSQALS